MGYILQTDEIALATQATLREQAVRAGKERALDLSIATPGKADTSRPYNGRYINLVERPFDYTNDFIIPTAGAAAAVGLAGWLSMPLAAIAGLYSVFADNVPAAVIPQVPNNQVWVFYKVSIRPNAGVIDPVTYLFFLTGQAQNRKDQFDLEVLYAKLSTDGYFTKPVVYDKTEFCGAQVRARLNTLVGCRVILHGWVIEPIQANLV